MKEEQPSVGCYLASLDFSDLNDLTKWISDPLDSKSFLTDKIWTRGKGAV